MIECMIRGYHSYVEMGTTILKYIFGYSLFDFRIEYWIAIIGFMGYPTHRHIDILEYSRFLLVIKIILYMT